MHSVTRSIEKPTTIADVVRLDIQGLRALAVAIVMLYHFWPNRLSGGYVGVDVFFVISGFLITSHLLRRPCVDAHTLLAFWARRIRRLLPAASVVLVAIALASLLWIPETMLANAGRETAAAALYMENWALALNATDYLAAEDTPGPVQHYWSLSVEEQFYFLWPIFIGLLVLVGRKIQRSQGILWIGMSGAVLGSLTASVWLTQEDPAFAYFATQTRIWELGVGGLLALGVLGGPLLMEHHRVRVFLSWLGLAAILCAALVFDERTPFPSWSALLPTLGTGVIILAEADHVSGSASAVLSLRPIQFLGDISYSVYLWHWPIIVLAPYALGSVSSWPIKIGLIALVTALAYASKTYIEDPLRHQRGWLRPLGRSYLMGATAMALVAATGLGITWFVAERQRADAAIVASALEAPSACFGAAAARTDGCETQGSELITSPAFARDDKPQVYTDRCWNGRPYSRRNSCAYGPKDASVRIALYGNSHVGHWFPPLYDVAQDRGWQITTYMSAECYPVTTITLSWDVAKLGTNCRRLNTWAMKEITDGDYDLVVMSARTYVQIKDVSPADKPKVAARAYAHTLASLVDAGSPVLVIRDTPAAWMNVPDCIAEHRGYSESCDWEIERAVEIDPLADAAKADPSGRVELLDVTNLFCDAVMCRTVIGGVIVYRDHGHMTTTFSRTLRPEVEAAVVRALER